MSKKSNHIHKYYKAELMPGAPKLWVCALPTCNHHMPKHYEMTLQGKLTLCFKCENPTPLDTTRWSMDKPLCDECLLGQKLVAKLEEEEVVESSSDDADGNITSIEERLKHVLG